MKEVVGAVVLGILLLFGLTWLVQGNDFFMYKIFAPKYEQVRRETFEQTKSYRQGMVQELQNMLIAYASADEAHKAAMADLILHRAADVPDEALTPELRQAISKLRRERMGLEER